MTRHTLWFLVGLYTLALLLGVKTALLTAPSRGDLALSLALATLCSWWAITDARHREYPIPLLTGSWFLVCTGIVVPGYVIWSRRWRGFAWLAVHAVMWLLVAAITGVLVGFVVHGPEWAQRTPR